MKLSKSEIALLRRILKRIDAAKPKAKAKPKKKRVQRLDLITLTLQRIHGKRAKVVFHDPKKSLDAQVRAAAKAAA